MVKVTKIEDSPLQNLKCPRGCGDLQYGRSITTGWSKSNNCKICGGLMLDLDDLKNWEKKGINNKIRKNKLSETLKAGKLGPLGCPKCRKKMVEIELFYKRGRFLSRIEEDNKKSLKEQLSPVRAIPIIGEFITAVMFTSDLVQDLKHGKLDKTVTIDGCSTCLIFWFDKAELSVVLSNDLNTR